MRRICVMCLAFSTTAAGEGGDRICVSEVQQLEAVAYRPTALSSCSRGTKGIPRSRRGIFGTSKKAEGGGEGKGREME